MVLSVSTVTTSRCSVASEPDSVFGRRTSMPRVIMGAVTMKMISRTRMTSTRGVTLMSDSAGPNRPRPRPGRVIAIASDADLARFDGSRGGAAGLDLGLGDRGESEDEAIDAAAQTARPGQEEVVADDGRDGGEQSGGGGDQRLGDPGRDRREAGGAGDADSLKGVHDAPDGPEQPDERSDGTGGGQQAEVAVEAVRLGRRGLLEPAPHALEDAGPLLVGDGGAAAEPAHPPGD